MDNPTRAWAPRPGLVGVGWVLTVISACALTGIVLSGDRPGSLLLGVITIAFAALSLHGTVVRPRLAADPSGIRLRTLGGTRVLRWSEVVVRLATTKRYGRDAWTVEIESGDRLTVLGWVELGADPHDVHDELVRLRQTPHSTG
ncbi:PH domain-containing protein [Saccharomonospora sp. NB11]|uniref:PH domain-containing protein n=1 Tax=Saccharomonospora sp. NB11 TaxID=1642298 RepID=UPI0018D19E00|nr:PH domain-containing protein [Saccharomonospora sp. NB11]